MPHDLQTVESPNIKFVLVGERRFVPRYYPNTLRARKPWKLNREEAFCQGEDVEQTTSKNRNVHVVGKLVGPVEKRNYELISDHGGPFTMSSATWSGEVLIKEAEIEGPIGIDVESKQLMWKYTLDMVSTGADEDSTATGIIDDGGTGESGGSTTGFLER